MLVFVEDSAEALVPSYAQADDLVWAGDRAFAENVIQPGEGYGSVCQVPGRDEDQSRTRPPRAPECLRFVLV
jgi:hypothetical protein